MKKARYVGNGETGYELAGIKVVFAASGDEQRCLSDEDVEMSVRGNTSAIW